MQASLGIETATMPVPGKTKGLHGMSKRVVLLRVGVDAGCGGIQGPLFKDGLFDFVCIPDNKGVSVHTYGNMAGRDGRPLAGYFAESRRKVMAEQHVHVDPEFDTFTDGGWDQEHRPALYLAGFFEVAIAGMACDFDKKVLKAEFGMNFHVRYRTVFEKQKGELVLVKGGPGSRFWTTAGKSSRMTRAKQHPPACFLQPVLIT